MWHDGYLATLDGEYLDVVRVRVWVRVRGFGFGFGFGLCREHLDVVGQCHVFDAGARLLAGDGDLDDISTRVVLQQHDCRLRRRDEAVEKVRHGAWLELGLGFGLGLGLRRGLGLGLGLESGLGVPEVPDAMHTSPEPAPRVPSVMKRSDHAGSRHCTTQRGMSNLHWRSSHAS